MRPTAIATALLLAPWLLAASGAHAEDARFPEVEGRNLEGRLYALPGEFEGTINIVMIAFEQWQQAQVDGWLPVAEELAERSALVGGVGVYELPTLGGGYRWLRSVIDGGMRAGIPDPVARARTITLYLDKAPFKTALAIEDENAIQILLVDRRGRILWRAEGEYDASSARELEARLQALELQQSVDGARDR